MITASLILPLNTSRMPKTAKLTISSPIRMAATQDFAKARMAASINSLSGRRQGRRRAGRYSGGRLSPRKRVTCSAGLA